jgi:hypothetical protein
MNASADPDFVMYRSGVPLSLGSCGSNPVGQCPPNAQRNEVASNVPVTAGTTYVIDAYDCANGCNTAQGTPGDYDLTISIQ